MSWIKKKLRNWLNSGNEISIAEDRAYAPQAHSNFGETQTSVQMFRAMNGTVLVLHTQHALQVKNTIGLGRQAGPTMYVLKEGESVQDAVATLLVKARLDSM
jgi:hypothetical protein